MTMTATATSVSPRQTTQDVLPGVGLTALGVAIAYLVNLALPAVNALTVAVVLGVVANHLPFVPTTTRVGLTWATRKLLRIGVVLLGLQLALPQLVGLGAGTLLAVVSTVAVAFLGTVAIGRLLGVSRGLGMMVATGFSICGASAIAAMESVVEPDDEDVATGVALVTLYGGLAIAAVPLVGGWLGLHGTSLGTWAGLSVHEVAQVVAAASPAGAGGVATAIVVKLSRVVLLAPMVALVGVTQRKRHTAAGGKRPPIVPLFVLGFLATIVVRSTGIVPHAVLNGANTLTTLLLAGALFGLGTAVKIPILIRTGGRAILLGLCSTVLVAFTAFVALQVFG